MTDRGNEPANASPDAFVCHPKYAGKSFDSVRRELEDEIERDQRAYDLALEGAENEEFDAFNSVREIEKRWSDYDFGWAEIPPKVLADRIIGFERARDERQHMMSWQEWKAESAPQAEVVAAAGEKTDWRENLTDEQRRKLASGLSVLVLLIMALVCVGAFMLIR